MGYGNANNTILLPDEEEQLVREELGRLASNPNAIRNGHGTDVDGDRYKYTYAISIYEVCWLFCYLTSILYIKL